MINEAAWQATRFLAIEASQGSPGRYYDSKDLVAAQNHPPRTVTLYTWYLARLEIVGLLGRVPASNHDLDLVQDAVGGYVRTLVGVHPRYVRLAVQMLFDMPRAIAEDMESSAFTSLTGVILGGLIRDDPTATIDDDKDALRDYLALHGEDMRHGQD